MMVQLNHLPIEIISDILSRLPFEHAIPCKQVCKTWRNILRCITSDRRLSLLFLWKHGNADFKFYHGEYDEKSNRKLSYNALTPLGEPWISYTDRQMFCSSRGLVCFYGTFFSDSVCFRDTKHPIYICNPFASQTVCLPQLALPKHADIHDFLVIGFGYLYATNEYKIASIFYENGKRGGIVQVYTLGDKSRWRSKGKTNHYMRKSEGVLYDGALHWIANMDSEIVAFDLTDEKFQSVPMPPCFLVTGVYVKLKLLGGHLSIVLLQEPGSGTDIWLLKKTNKKIGYTVEADWSNEFTMHISPGYYHPFALTEEKKVLLWRTAGTKILMRWQKTLYQYDPKTATLENIGGDVERYQYFRAIPFMKSDVKLTELVPDLPRTSYFIFRPTPGVSSVFGK